MRKSILLQAACVAALLSLLVPDGASAQAKTAIGKRPTFMGDELLSTLALTKEQKQQIDQLRMGMDRDLRPLNDEQQRLMRDFDMMWRGPSSDDRGLKNVMRKLVRVSAKIDARSFEFQVELFNILNQRQRRALSDKSRERCEKAPGDMWLGQPGAMNACPPPPQNESPLPGNPRGGQPGGNPPVGNAPPPPGNKAPPAGNSPPPPAPTPH